MKDSELPDTVVVNAPTDAATCDASPVSVEPRSQAAPSLPQPAQPSEVVPETSSSEPVTLTLDGFALDEATLARSPMLPYLAMLASLIERRVIGREELLQALLRSMRQRSFDRLPRREYALRFLKQHPP